ncbi:hypothetical protein H9P43_003091 [Blastocladiella emersonii ATCC 22665]|nr:hypothetical protein H9P43_003091 [Blastocladiella emersonii ATCC 22665]
MSKAFKRISQSVKKVTRRSSGSKKDDGSSSDGSASPTPSAASVVVVAPRAAAAVTAAPFEPSPLATSMPYLVEDEPAASRPPETPMASLPSAHHPRHLDDMDFGPSSLFGADAADGSDDGDMHLALTAAAHFDAGEPLPEPVSAESAAASASATLSRANSSARASTAASDAAADGSMATMAVLSLPVLGDMDAFSPPSTMSRERSARKLPDLPFLDVDPQVLALTSNSSPLSRTAPSPSPDPFAAGTPTGNGNSMATPAAISAAMDDYEYEMASRRVLAEYCFNVAYVADWMSGDIPPPVDALEQSSAAAAAAAADVEKKRKKSKRGPRIKLPGHHKAGKDAPAVDRSPSFHSETPAPPLKVGPLAQHVMDLFDWEPHYGYEPMDVRMLFLHLKAFVESLTSLASAGSAPTPLSATVPPQFLLPAQFPSQDHFSQRIHHIIKAMRAEIALLADAHPSVMQSSLGVVSSNSRLLATVKAQAAAAAAAANGGSDADETQSQSGSEGSVTGGPSAVGSGSSSAGHHRDWIRVLVPDNPYHYLEELLGMMRVQVLSADEQLPLDRKSKALIDRVCQFWRISQVTKDALLAQWVLHALQDQAVPTLWPSLTMRIDKLELTVRRERATMSRGDQRLLRTFMAALTRHAKWYVSAADDDSIHDLATVLTVNKHLDVLCELIDTPATGAVVEAFAHGYTRRLLGMQANASDPSVASPSSSAPGELMARLNHAAEQLPFVVESLKLPELQRNQVAFLLAHSFLVSAAELCPIRMPDKETREELTAVCHQYRRMREVEDLMEDARQYLVEFADVELTQRRHSFTPDHLVHLEFQHELQMQLVNEKPPIDFVWDEWLLQLEDDLCEEVESQIEEHLGLGNAMAGGDQYGFATSGVAVDAASANGANSMHALLDLLLKYLQYVEGFPFPSSHHVVRMAKSLTRIFTRAITQSAQMSYRHILDAPHDRHGLSRGTVAARIRQLQLARNELSGVQQAIQQVTRALDLDEYVTPFLADEVMVRIDLFDKPVGFVLEVRSDGELLVDSAANATRETISLPILGERTLELTMRAEDEDVATALGIEDPAAAMASTVVIGLYHADEGEHVAAFDDTPVPVVLTATRAEDAYAAVYFQGCWDRITETMDSLIVVFADKVAQQILAIAKDYKKFLKTQNRGGFLHQLQQQAASVAPANYEASISSIFDSVKMTLKRSNTLTAAAASKLAAASGASPSTPATPAVSAASAAALRQDEAAQARYRLGKADELQLYLSAVAKALRDLEGPDRSGAALADQLRDGIWQTLSARMAQHVLRNKAGTALKERPLAYIEWLNTVLVRCRDALFPVDESAPLDAAGARVQAPQSYLLVLLSRYSMDTDALQQEYLSNIMSYLDFKSQRAARERQEALARAAEGHPPVPADSAIASLAASSSTLSDPAAESDSAPRTPGPGPATLLRRQPTKADPLLARITSNRQSVFFDSNLFKETPGTLQRRPPKTPTGAPASRSGLRREVGGSRMSSTLATSEGTATRRPPRGGRGGPETRPLSVFAPMRERPMTMLSTRGGSGPSASATTRRTTTTMAPASVTSRSDSLAPSDPLHYPLFAVLAILRVRAETDPEIRTWLDEQKAVEQTIMQSMQLEEEAASAGAAAVVPEERRRKEDGGSSDERDLVIGSGSETIRVEKVARPRRPRTLMAADE